MTLQKVPVNNFKGGLNTRDGPFDLMPNESPDLLNVTISSLVGQLQTRKGKEVYGENIPANVDYAKQCVIGTKRFLMLSVNGNVYSVDSTGAVVKRHAGTAGTIWDFEVFPDAAEKLWVWMVNGTDAPQKWNMESAETVAWVLTKKGLVNAKGETEETEFHETVHSGAVLQAWQGRLCISYVKEKEARLYFSEFFDPEAVNHTYGFVDIFDQEEDRDQIVDIAVLGARLFVFKKRSVHLIASPATFANRRIGSPGAWDRFQVEEMEDKLYFFNPQGLWSTAGVAIAMESGSINNWFPKNLAQTHLSQARLITTRDTYPRLLLAVCTGSHTENDTLIEMVPHINFRRIGGRRYLLLPAFMLHTISATALTTWNPTGHEELIISFALGGGLGNFVEREPFTDTLEQGSGENPLSKGGKWLKWAWTNSAGELEVSKGSFGWTSKEANKLEGARWTVGEFTNPQASIGLGGEVGKWGLNVCFAAAAHSGYTIRLTRKVRGTEPWEEEATVAIEKWVAGVKTVLVEHTFITGPTLQEWQNLGVIVASGKIQVWVKTEAGWSIKLEVVDATYNKGYSGFEYETAGAPRPFSVFDFDTEEVKNPTMYKTFSGETDAGKAIEAYWQSAWLPVQEQEPRERVRRLNVEFSGDAVVDVFTDFEANPRFTAVLPKEGEKGEFDEPPGGELAYRFARVRPETYGRYHAIRFRTNTAGKPFLINAAELVVRGGKQH